MSSLSTPSPAYGINPDTFLPRFPTQPALDAAYAPNDFARLVHLTQSHERLSAEQRALVVKLERARSYQADPCSHPNLARANLQHLKTKYSGILALLRANRHEAVALLSRLGSGPSGHGEGPPAVACLSAVRGPRLCAVDSL
jgi:hypothetical protein